MVEIHFMTLHISTAISIKLSFVLSNDIHSMIDISEIWQTLMLLGTSSRINCLSVCYYIPKVCYCKTYLVIISNHQRVEGLVHYNVTSWFGTSATHPMTHLHSYENLAPIWPCKLTTSQFQNHELDS